MNTPFLNLLPPEYRRRYSDLLLFLTIRRTVVSVATFFVFATVVVFASLFLLNRTLADQKAETTGIQARLATSNGATLDQEIRTFNAMLSRVNAMQSGYISWTPILRELFLLIPPGVTLSNFEIDGKTKVATIRGTAALRDDLLVLQDALSHSPRFTNPSSPISNLLQRENILFEIRFSVTIP